MTPVLSHNLVAWMAQVILLASAGALLPLLLRLRHPGTQLTYCQLLLSACLLLPVVEPWSHPRLLATADGLQQTAPMITSAGHPHDSGINQAQFTATKAVPPAIAAATPPSARWTMLTSSRLLLWILGLGALARVCWLLVGLWQIRGYRIASTPLYPIPESITAASAVTHADALFCICPRISGPVMLGWLTPVVLLPESFLDLDEEAQCGVACHELLHVRRGDWVATLLEELIVALLWFNPAAWMLLAQARLAREEVVDAETVRLIAAREPYIDALLSIAGRRQTLDLAPASMFLRRRHLTHRMHSLLKEVTMSRSRLVSSYGLICATLAAAGWFALASFPLIGQPRLFAAPTVSPSIAEEPAPAPPQLAPAVAPRTRPAQLKREPQTTVAFAASRENMGRFSDAPMYLPSVPIPPDPQEPVAGGVESASEPSARAAALSLLEHARANGLTHRPGTPPYRLEVNFNTRESGPGQLTETWLSGQLWRWTATLGSYSVIRVPGAGTASGESEPGVVPMSVHSLRNAIFWAARGIPWGALVRTAAVQWNGRPATCVLTSGVAAPTEQTRLWEEEEYCIDNASGLIEVLSMAPGGYTIYSYEENLQFHGQAIPDRIVMYAHGAKTLDAEVNLADAGTVDQSELLPTPEMLAAGPVATLLLPTRFPIDVANASVAGNAKPVMVHASVGRGGKVVDEELLAASDPALAQAALDLVKATTFQTVESQQQMYINVRFVRLVPAQ
jgi:beta-lactamase regulating signal transducer with metallopeptidase domain